MFRNGIGTGEIILLLAVVLLLFGAKRLPDTARGLGRSLRIFKAETKGLNDDDDATTPAPPVTPPQPVATTQTDVTGTVAPPVAQPASPPVTAPVPQADQTSEPGGQR